MFFGIRDMFGAVLDWLVERYMPNPEPIVFDLEHSDEAAEAATVTYPGS